VTPGLAPAGAVRYLPPMGSLRFRLFGFPVEVQLGFWLLALIIGVRPNRPAIEAVVWLVVIFVSILIHELGHAFVARRYGQQPSIVLHMLGGVTSWRSNDQLSRGRRILVTLAGPGAGFVLGFVAYAALLGGTQLAGGAKDAQPVWLDALGLLAFANVFWSVINLLPVLPFDGGQVLATALGPERRKLSATLSMVFGLITAFVLYRLGSWLGALLFAMGGVSNFLSAWQAPGGRTRVPPEAAREILAQAERMLEAGDHERASALAAVAAEAATTPEERKKAFETMVWARLLAGDVAGARNLARAAREAIDPYVLAAVSEANGDASRALGLVETAREAGDRRVEVAAMAVRLMLQAGRAHDASEIAIEIADSIPDDDLEKLSTALADTGEVAAAARLRDVLGERRATT